MVVERLTKQEYGAYMREHVFKRLGMSSASMCYARMVVPHLASGYEVMATRWSTQHHDLEVAFRRRRCMCDGQRPLEVGGGAGYGPRSHSVITGPHAYAHDAG